MRWLPRLVAGVAALALLGPAEAQAGSASRGPSVTGVKRDTRSKDYEARYWERERKKRLRNAKRDAEREERKAKRRRWGPRDPGEKYCIYGVNGEVIHAPPGAECGGEAVPASPAPGKDACVKGDCRNGQGTYVWANGSRYVGGFKNGRQHGHGVLIFSDGSSYVGAWSSGKRHGEGTATHADGRLQSGLWDGDRFVGRARARARVPAVSWPDLSQPAASVGGGKKDAALIVGLENYAHVASIPGAAANAAAWYDYLVRTRGVPLDRTALLLDDDATLEEVRHSAETAAAQVKKGGTLWFVFIGHGAPASDGKDGLLVGFDAQQKARSIEARSIGRRELLETLEDSKAARVNVLLDACFSGQIDGGQQLVAGLQPLVVSSSKPTRDRRTTLLTAARSDQYAGPLPGTGRPAFSYLALGALRGWADRDRNGRITAGELHSYVTGAMRAIVRGRKQTPSLVGRNDANLATSPREQGPDLAALVVKSATSSEASSR